MAAIPGGQAQLPVHLTGADSAQLRVAALRVVFDSLQSPWTESTRLWVRLPNQYDSEAKQWREFAFTALEWATISGAFPNAVRFSREDQPPFLCPSVLIPGRGCPIKDGGIIVTFGQITLGADGTVLTIGGLIQSSGNATWRQSLGMRFVRSDLGIWQLVETPWRWIRPFSEGAA